MLPEHRPLYKIGQLLLILQLGSRGGKSSLPRIQLFNWALKRKEREAILLDASQKGYLKVSAWGFDPAVAIAISYALAEELIQTTSTGYSISSAGMNFVAAFCKDPDCFSSERLFLGKIGKSITEAMVTQVSRGWEEQ